MRRANVPTILAKQCFVFSGSRPSLKDNGEYNLLKDWDSGSGKSAIRQTGENICNLSMCANTVLSIPIRLPWRAPAGMSR